MSRHCTPASASARRMAIAPMSIPVRSLKRPNGCNPTPTIATSMCCLLAAYAGARSADRPECERHDLVAIVVGTERHQHELHVHADPQPLGLSEARLDSHLVAELH